jgi:hypothetical protein
MLLTEGVWVGFAAQIVGELLYSDNQSEASKSGT